MASLTSELGIAIAQKNIKVRRLAALIVPISQVSGLQTREAVRKALRSLSEDDFLEVVKAARAHDRSTYKGRLAAGRAALDVLQTKHHS